MRAFGKETTLLGTSLASPVVAELGAILLAALVFWAASKRYGLPKASLFLAGAILWTALLENLSVVAGEYTYYHYSNMLFSQYPGYLFWVGAVPLWVLLGWFILAMSSYIIFYEVLLPQRRASIQAAAAALFAVNVDLMLDPTASANGLWVWLSGSYRYLGVPAINFFGWFLLIFFFNMIAQHTIFQNRPLRFISRVERTFFGDIEERSESPDPRRFLFRIIVVEILIFLVLYILAALVDYIAAGGL